MIKPICDRCGKELEEFGALLFSPPDKYNGVIKYHLCKECFNALVDDFRTLDLFKKLNSEDLESYDKI